MHIFCMQDNHLPNTIMEDFSGAETKFGTASQKKRRSLEALINQLNELPSPVASSEDKAWTPSNPKGHTPFSWSNQTVPKESVPSGDVGAVPIPRASDVSSVFRRWGHSCVCVHPSDTGGDGTDPRLLVFGGFGGDPWPERRQKSSKRFQTDSRLNTLCEASVCSQSVRCEWYTGLNAPPRRQHHVALLITPRAEAKQPNGKRPYLLVHGGRSNPKEGLTGVHVLNTDTMEWVSPASEGEVPPGLWRHAAVEVNGRVYVWGGRRGAVFPGGDLTNDMFVLHLDQFPSRLRWEKLDCRGVIPSPRHSHSLTAIGTKLLLFGGLESTSLMSNQSDGGVYLFDPETRVWSAVQTTGDKPTGCYSHSATLVGKHLVVLCSAGPARAGPVRPGASKIHVLNVETWEWYQPHTSRTSPSHSVEPHRRDPDPCDFTLFFRHSATLVGSTIVVLGGGGLCFSFGSFFSPATLLSCEDVHANRLKINIRSLPTTEGRSAA